LNCASCHATKDRHWGLFGADCAQCHGTTKWTVPEFRHPSPRSTECAQCHQATQWHYMEMCFQMMTKVAREPSAKVNECYKCHQTTSWNDIKGFGKVTPGCPCMKMMSGDMGGPGQPGKMQTDNQGGMSGMHNRGTADTAGGAASNQSEIQALLAGAEEMFRTNRLLRPAQNTPTASSTSSAGTSPSELEKWSGPELGLFTLKSLSSSDVALSDFRGKPVIVHFFATWCGPCREEMVGLRRFVSRIKNKDLSVLAVSVGESDDRVRRFFDAAPVNFQILLDQDKTITGAWLVATLPTTYVLSPELKPKLILRGAQQWDQLEVAQILKKLDNTNHEPSQPVSREPTASPEKK
jgi:peroxiredoxin